MFTVTFSSKCLRTTSWRWLSRMYGYSSQNTCSFSYVLALDPYPCCCVGIRNYNDIPGRSCFQLDCSQVWWAWQVNSYGGLLAIRICLGLCEGGLLPGIVTIFLHTFYDAVHSDQPTAIDPISQHLIQTSWISVKVRVIAAGAAFTVT